MNTSKSEVIRLNPKDNVGVAARDLKSGESLPGIQLSIREPILFGHKVAVGDIGKGEKVLKYGQVIGVASRPVCAGEHVHTHNLEMPEIKEAYQYGMEGRLPLKSSEEGDAFFDGFLRDDGKAGTRNYIGVMATANCSAGVVQRIARSFDSAALAQYPNVDGVMPIVHGSGCGLPGQGEGIDTLQRVLGGWARHPNFAGMILVGLGCEINQTHEQMERTGLETGPLFRTLEIQSAGGSNNALRKGIASIKEMLPEANRAQRQRLSLSYLMLGLECGGSDALSGITANPALGAASDLLVKRGGAAILGETTEIYGAEHLLLQRAVSRGVAEKLLERIKWWEAYTRMLGAELNNNPSPGNKAGGLTTILEKSLGAVSKGGTAPLQNVYLYGERVEEKGFVFMDTPGYDPASVTGMVAGGANIICFTTGRGSVFGGKPVPALKLASNNRLFNNMADDMDINCGPIIDGEMTVEKAGEAIFKEILDTASGKKTKGERSGLGDEEFVPWILGATL